MNIIVGPNASGKTNLLESLLMLARGNSYRAHDAELVQLGQPWARIDGIVDGERRTVKIVNEPVPEKAYEVAGKTLRKLSLERTIPAVLFEPNHLLLLTGSPERRRDYLDELLIQTESGYGTAIRAYRRTLSQRNHLLKSGHAPADQLFPWDVRLSELGGRIVRARSDLVARINNELPGLYRDLSQSTTGVAVTYQTAADSAQYESQMLRQLEVRRADDIQRGFTTFGPHRDDLFVAFDGRPAEEVASRGETRTFVLVLKILELQLLSERRDQSPVVLLDDVFSELDGARRKALTAHLRMYQTFITTTDADVVVHHFADECNVLLLTKG